jgi:hypothetical protein
MPPVFFGLIILEIVSHFWPRQVWIMTPSILCILPVLGWQACTTRTSSFLLRWYLTNFVSRLTLNHDPPILCLLSSYIYRNVPPCLTPILLILSYSSYISTWEWGEHTFPLEIS